MATMSVPERRQYDYIVVGCGGIGSAALYWLSRRSGSNVLGLEQFELGHSNGGSQDHSRIIRMAYHDDIYTKLTPETYKAWEEIERESGIQVVWRTGSIILGKKGDGVTMAYGEAMGKHNIPYERLSGSQLRSRFPQFDVDENYVAIYNKDGGLVDAAMANAVHIQLARGYGASVIEHCPVTRLAKDANGNTLVSTPKGTFSCKKVVVTSGSWTNQVIGSVGVHIPLYVTQEQVSYFATPNMKDFVKNKFPIWIYQKNNRDFYGLPIHGNTGSKIGIDAGGPVVTPETRSFIPDPVREEMCREVFREILPSAQGPLLYSKTCLYDMPPDRKFIIDTCHRTGHRDVIVCVGAGHAYKFAGLLGKILSEMALDGRTSYDIAPFTLDRQALKDPTFKPVFFMGSDLPAVTGNPQAKAKL